MMYVWVVMGKRGVWEEKRWCVKVMDSKEKAISFINKLKDIIKSKEEIGKNMNEIEYGEVLHDAVKHFDNYVYVEDGILDYFYEQVHIDADFSDNNYSQKYGGYGCYA